MSIFLVINKKLCSTGTIYMDIISVHSNIENVENLIINLQSLLGKYVP